MRRDSSYSSGGKTEDSLGRACVGPPRDDATAHRTWDHGRRSSSSSSSSPHLTSPHLTSPHLTSPHLTSPHLTSPHLTSPHLTSPHLTSPHLFSLKLPNVKKHNFTSVPPGKLRELFPPTSLYSEKSSLTETGFELLAAFLASDPQRRISAAQALNHRYFLEVPPPQEVSLMPTFKATNEQPRKKRKRGADDPNRETKKALGVAV